MTEIRLLQKQLAQAAALNSSLLAQIAKNTGVKAQAAAHPRAAHGAGGIYL